jgi:hypothetical protein
MTDEQARYQRIRADGHQIRELARLLCGMAREQRAICAERRRRDVFFSGARAQSLPSPARNAAP